MIRYIKKYNDKVHRIKALTVIIDDREKKPWNIDQLGFLSERARLKVGDYSIKGYEDRVAIEKKSGLTELLIDLSSRNRPRFRRFLAKMAAYEIKCMVIEDSMSGINRALMSLPGTHLTHDTVLYWLSKMITDYGIPVLLIGKRKKTRERILYYILSAVIQMLDEGNNS